MKGSKALCTWELKQVNEDEMGRETTARKGGKKESVRGENEGISDDEILENGAIISLKHGCEALFPSFSLIFPLVLFHSSSPLCLSLSLLLSSFAPLPSLLLPLTEYFGKTPVWGR